MMPANSRLRSTPRRTLNQSASPSPSPSLSPSLSLGRGQGGGLYQCSQCDRRYNRTEHLARHVRSHTKQRPYPCQVCHKPFARRDVLKRHQATHSRSQHEHAQTASRPSIQDFRASRACQSCAATKTKCSDQKPCHRCVTKKLECTYPDDPEPEPEPDTTEVESPRLDESETPNGHSNHQDEPQDMNTIIVRNPESTEQSAESPAAAFHLQPQSNANTTHDPSFDDQSISLHDFLSPMAFPDLFDFSVQPLQMLENFSLPDSDMANIGLSSSEAHHDQTNTNLIQFTPQDGQQTVHDAFEVSSPLTDSSVTGSWEPQPRENGEVEHAHLAAGDEGFKTPALGHNLDKSPLKMGLSTAGRDIVLNMILGTTSRANSTLILTAFPCKETLNKLIRIYAQGESNSYIDDILHYPTLDFNHQRPELLGAMIAMGASNAGTTMACKFGYAMQEVVRASSFRSWEEDNGNCGDLGLAQGFLIQQYIAFFSGVRRKIALAVSCANCIQVMIKCGLHLRGALSRAYGPRNLAHLDGQSLEDAWREWAVDESQRRLCYAAYILDAHVSLSHGIQSITPYVNMNLPLPAPRGLWTAKTSTEWKTEMLRLQRLNRPQQPVCLRDAMADPVILITHGELIHAEFAASSFLAGMWTLIRELHQFDLITHDASTWNSLLVSSRRAEVLSVLNLFGSQVIGTEAASPKLRLLCEAMSMHAMVTPDNLVLPKLTSLRLHGKMAIPSTAVDGLKLSTNFEYRAALWRTGRILHAAARCPPGAISGVYIIALFHAAIFLWWYGIKLLRQDGHLAGMKVPKVCVCVLNGDSSHEHQVLSGQFELALMGGSPGSPPIPLTNVPDAMECIRKIVVHSWRDRQMPINVHEICCVLTNLGTAAQNFEF